MNAPTLIIGLGGKGSEVALKVSKMLSAEQRKQIGFAIFDTDVNELRKIREENPFVHTIQTSTKLSVGEYLNIDTHARDTWFPVNAILNSKTLTEGAGQVRAISRMAFETSLRAGKVEELHKAIEELYKLTGEQYQQALRVIIVSSLAGGTGSGLILPVALYVKNYLATHFRQSANITRGFFLLPEVFYGVIPGNAERNNLKCNAYATLRELDAFLMKGDDTLPEKYRKTVRMEFPNVGSNEYEEYNVRPFDFCFLFDAQNCDGNKLNSFEAYLDHAANCIYAMSIGPMNKRSNSSEDNVIRKLCAENGRNRYAGAGTSRLVYPVDDIREYLAKNWTKEAVSAQWLEFDNMFKAQAIKIAKDRKKGLKVPDLKENIAYIDAVEAQYKNRDPFAAMIINSCQRMDDSGFEVEGNSWDDYMGALEEKVTKENSNDQTYLAKDYEDATVKINGIEPGGTSEDWDQYIEAYKAARKYYKITDTYIEEKARMIAYSIFDSDAEGVTKTTLPFKIEKYMRNSVGNFMHPNAIRYMLYKVRGLMEERIVELKNDVDLEKHYFATFESNTFDDKGTDEIETYNDLYKTGKVSLIDKISKKFSARQQELIDAYRAFMTKVDSYRIDAVMLAVLEEGLVYVKNLCEAFSQFYKSFESKVSMLDQEIHTLENKHASSKGTTARYVCASPKCMQKFLEKVFYTGGEIEIDSSLAEQIYQKIFEYAMMPTRPKKSNHFAAIFDEGIEDYFRQKLNSIYSLDIDLDIISAIERELIYEDDTNEHSPAELEQYVCDVFNEAKTLAAPFIEKPMGEEMDPIPACAYNIGLNPKDDSPRAKMIDRELKNFGGVPDEDIPKNEILFYKSFYGLRANELSKFAPPQKTVTYDRPSGEYYKAYFELVSKIYPIPNKSRVITPHIDRWWHIITMMPDLDDDSQAEQERNVYAAFFWSLLNSYINLFDADSERPAYRLKNADEMNLADSSSTLVVSNGTPCDKLYEVMDAFSIYPALVNAVLERAGKELQTDLNAHKAGDRIGIQERLDSFVVSEFNVSDNRARSIFDLPLLLKRSMTTEMFDEDKMLTLLKVEISEIMKYMEQFVQAKDYADEVGAILEEQFNRFIVDIEIEKEYYKDIYHDYLFTNTCYSIAKALDDIGKSSIAKKIREKEKELSRMK